MLGKKINGIKINGGRNDFPVIALGQYSVGQGGSKVYPTTAEISVNKTYGVNGVSFRFERPSGTLIAVGDPDSDVGQYLKFTNKALSVDGSGDPYGNLKGLQIETRNQGKVGTLYALQTQARTSAGTGYEATNVMGHYLEVKVDPSATAPTTLGHTKAVLYCAVDAPAASYGVQAYNSTDGTYTYPEYAFLVDGNVGKWQYGLYIADSKVSVADIHLGTGAAGSTVEGDLWYDASAHVIKYYNGSDVKTIATV